MKKTNLLLIFAITFTFLFSCKEHKCKCDCDDWQSQIPEGTFCYSDEGRTKEMLNYDELIDMLKNFDRTRIAPLESALGYQDARVHTYDFEQLKKYLGHIENLSKKSKVKITGISFIAGAKKDYKGTGRTYQDLIYIPTTTVNGKQIPFDPLHSARQGKLVTFKDMLAKHGYKWIYNSAKEFKEGRNPNYDYSLPVRKQNEAGFFAPTFDKGESGAGNRGVLQPPY